jgi:hypothetical protein
MATGTLWRSKKSLRTVDGVAMAIEAEIYCRVSGQSCCREATPTVDLIISEYRI